MPIWELHTLTKSLSFAYPVSGKRNVLVMMMVFTFALCVAGGAGTRVTGEEDARPCVRQPPLTSCHTPGDYDGDHKADLAVFRPGEGAWFVLQSSDDRLKAVHWGIDGDRLVSADYDGDGKEDFAVYRKSVGTWWILYSSSLQWYSRQFGDQDAEPAPGDYDGDGKADLAISRGGVYTIIRSTDASEETIDMRVHDLPLVSNHNDIDVPGDYDGDGLTDPAILHDPNPSRDPDEDEPDLEPAYLDHQVQSHTTD